MDSVHGHSAAVHFGHHYPAISALSVRSVPLLCRDLSLRSLLCFFALEIRCQKCSQKRALAFRFGITSGVYLSNCFVLAIVRAPQTRL